MNNKMQTAFEDFRNSIVFAVSMARDVRKYLREERDSERLFLTL